MTVGSDAAARFINRCPGGNLHKALRMNSSAPLGHGSVVKMKQVLNAKCLSHDLSPTK
jgi:hypothetical protein